LGVAAQITRVQQPDDYQPANYDDPNAQALTRGPVHEAFAGMIEFNPEPGIIVKKQPPEPIEEVPPDERPEGDNVSWIPGYWAWDDDRNDFMWISGTWRSLPPGREWMAGYWTPVSKGYQWVSGYWADTAQREVAYLPQPPETIEAGPSVPAPSADYIWTPGCWVWYSGHYAWRPGYWAVGRPDWDWVPAHYVWSPGGYIFVGGYWDYPVVRRGVLFAPVFFQPHVYAHQHFVYSPAIVIDLGVFSNHLFCRPRYHHYYFGDYYAPAYVGVGFYASFSFHIGHHGYDPIFSHERWVHRHEHGWDHRLEASYRQRREHVEARPPRTWSQQRNITVNRTRVENNIVVANTFEQYRKRTDNSVRFQSVSRDERQRFGQRTREVQSSRERRQTVELQAPNRGNVRANEARPFRAEVPKSSIVAAPVRDSRSRPELTPPRAPREPRPDSSVQLPREPQRRASERTVERQPSSPRAAERNTERPTRSPAQQEARTEPAPEPRVTPAPRVAPAPERPSAPSPERRPPVRPQAPSEQRTLPPPARGQGQAPSVSPPERRAPLVPPESRAPVARPQHPSTPDVHGRAQQPRVSRPEQAQPSPSPGQVERARPSRQPPISQIKPDREELNN